MGIIGMLDNDLQEKIDGLINQIVSYWGNNVSIINIITHKGAPFDIFEVSTLLYNRFDVMFEYERSTIGIGIKVANEYIGLSRLSKLPIYRGFDSYSSESNILHNFQALDDVLHSM
jgi:hypothetical protein